MTAPTTPIRAVGRLHRARRRTATFLAAAALALVLPGCGILGSTPSGPEITAEFERGTGLYPGSPVRVLGIDIGRVTEVDNVDGHVRVRLQLDEGEKLPADARATIVPLTLLGERYIQLGPAWTDGPTLSDGDTIPLARTSVPAEIDELLRGLQDFLGAIDPERAGQVVTRLSEILDGRGQDLNELIGNADGTLKLLADEGDDLRTIVGSLGDLTATLKGRTDSIEELVRNYDLVAQVLIDNKGDLDGAITQLDRLSAELTDLLLTHEDPLREDVDVITATGRTIAANTEELEITLASTVKLFDAAQRAYEAKTNSLRANNQLAPDVTADLLAGRLRDRIAGLCRRLGIDLCSDPASALLNELSGLLPGLLSDLQNGLPVGNEPIAPTTPAVPPTTAPTPTVPTPAAPSTDDLLASLSSQLTSQLDEAQRALLAVLDPERLTALLALDPALLQVLSQLDAAQVELLRTVDVAQLGPTLLELTNLLNPPSTRLEPLLPGGTAPATPPPPDGLVDLAPLFETIGQLGQILGGA